MIPFHHFTISPGSPTPYGPSKTATGYNFSLYSKQATTVSLCLFTSEGDCQTEIPLDSQINRTGDIWHIEIEDLSPETLYAYRIDGIFDPQKGLFFDNRIFVHDPYAKALASSPVWGETHDFRLGIVDPNIETFDWEGDRPIQTPKNELIIYEMHVRGFTADPSSQVENPGTFLGIIEKIPYLVELGVNAVELLPIFEFDENDSPFVNPITKEPLKNYWGYSTINFFAPTRRYGSIEEFKLLVKELHSANIEVILDVVYNHTAEGNENGPNYSFKGIANSAYYILGPNGEYYNFSGCGNTFNCNHPYVQQFICDSLHYWVNEMHVDGFRFDLASILTRHETGAPLETPPLIERLNHDPLLAKTRLIAEPWDPGGLYQVGSFPGNERWMEWNGHYRDVVRSFIKGTDGASGAFAGKISGSEDLYGPEKSPLNSINFITCHDGFTLKDLVSFQHKHNRMNGERNTDGCQNNLSWNCGAEGETKDPHVISLRERQLKNFHLALMISQGIPMIHMGDEYGHSKNGNNNTWGHDSPVNWFQWNVCKSNASFHRFYRRLIKFRKEHPVLTRAHFLHQKDVHWHGLHPFKPDWGEANRLIAFTLPDPLSNEELFFAFNAHFEEKTLHLPQGENWQLIIDSAAKSPNDFLDMPRKLSEFKWNLSPYSSIGLKRSIEPNGLYNQND